jgi:hypothetical protein
MNANEWKRIKKFFALFQSGANGTAIPSEGSDFSEDQESPKISHKPFFRRLSFKALRKGKVIKFMVMIIKFRNLQYEIYAKLFFLSQNKIKGSISDDISKTAFR